MKQKTKIIGMILSAVLLFVSLIVVIANFMGEPAKKMAQAKETRETLIVNGSVSNGSIEVSGAHNSQSYYKNGNFYYEYEEGAWNKVYCPSLNDIQLYCIQRGGPLRNTKNSVDSIRALDGTIHSIGHSTPLPAKRYSNTFYVCVNNHTQLNAVGAYIITAPSIYTAPYPGIYKYGYMEATFERGEDISEEIRQVAAWINPALNQGESFYAAGTQFSYTSIAQNLSNEADEYQEYEEKLKQNVGEPIKETTEERAKVNVNNQEQYLIIGPYKMDYMEGRGSYANFSGISNIRVEGYNDKKKQKYLRDAEIISYIQNGEEKTLDFYKPTKELGYVDYNQHSYPASGQEFYLKIKNPNQQVRDSNEKVNYLGIKVDYGYMLAEATKCELEGHQLVAIARQISHRDTRVDGELVHISREYQWRVSESPIPRQKMMDAWGNRTYYVLTIELSGRGKKNPNPNDDDELIPLDITMNLGGHVWEDVRGTKESMVDGINYAIIGQESNDKPIANVKVTLHECILDENGHLQYQNGQIVSQVLDLLSDINDKQMSQEEIERRMNPQLTDKDGYYQFDGLDSSNKYFVTFEYNGQVYMPTEYLVTDKDEEGKLIQMDTVQDMVVNAKLYNTDTWKITSKVAEKESERERYDAKFVEIGSYPQNYVSSNSLNCGRLEQDGSIYYNETFSIYKLMGFELQGDGTYQDTGVQLIDSFYIINEKGNIEIAEEIQEGLISRRIKNYMNQYHEYPDEKGMLEIYENIAGNNQELWRKLQFIEDCKMQAYTRSAFKNDELDLYPVYKDFTIGSEEMVIPGIGTKPPIYDGQYYVNAGLWERQKVAIALRKDVYKAATRINGKTEVYNYDKRGEDEKYWEIHVRMQDYNNYYGTNYTRQLYPADYNYRSAITNLSGKDLELYVTYKITVRNNSQGILANIPEVVDYYDKDYTYQPDLSWIMYKDKTDGGKEETAKIAVPSKSYYNMIDTLNGASKEINHARDVKASYATTQNRDGSYTGESIYGDNTKSDLEQELNSLYITGLDGKKLQTGESAYIYLTFKVNSDSRGPVILDDDNSLKENYVEINGYETYYSDTTLPNKVSKSSQDIAGIVDKDSTPGNLELKDLEGDHYEKNFENDTDRAKSIKVTLEDDDIRYISGTVWEDERTKTVENAIIGDGIRQKDEIGINGVTIELVEKLADGKEYVWQTIQSRDGGKYEFANIIPGDYIVRFNYGNNKETVQLKANGGENAVSYNGQDFKSTVYQKNMSNNQELQMSQTQYYDISEADSYQENLSDAKDLWESKTVNIGRTTNNQTNFRDEMYQGRNNVNNYSNENVTNHKAEVLNSPYAQNQNQDLLNELMKNTNMVAETAIIVLEGEYNRTETDESKEVSNGKDRYLNGNDYNGTYTLHNVDFGITERPKAQLEINKKVNRVKVTHSDGKVAFDTTQAMTDVVWLAKREYNLDSKMSKNKYEEYYQESIQNAKYNRYSYREQINKLIESTYKGHNGLIQVTQDAELMHGTNIEITYSITVKNVGETDYTGQDFYYKGNTTNGHIVTTTANEIIDYVPNNLQYRENQNEGWNLVKTADITNNEESRINERLVNNSLEQQVKRFNTILTTTQNINTTLTPGQTTPSAKTLVLTQTITPENKTDDMSYEVLTEIVKTSNEVGRRMAYSVVGNQDPTANPAEVDSAKAERVVILPPAGRPYLYIGLATAVLAILAGGIVIIKKMSLWGRF